ncbi:MAG: DUF86 domain-containing protein [Saprospiraceae bacterium]|uniref:HepT-like ribonuclease domain-containing protein n=1 Tax=Candidatus Brachybacter algidus TaxID=2982024 RepID=UPI0025802F57|nr:HepT-like ribonuclease domain-containing protein [Candidatus Brachybacter algidus]MBK7604387.1 DUF86 domain-containing protein [Candidatus Brachybacter algidus]
MDKPTSIERVQHILDAIQLIGQFVEGENEVTFVKDVKLQSAVQYQFLIIVEAIKHIDNGILLKYNYPWHIPRSFRNFIIHVYHGIKMERIYYATQDLKELKAQLNKILENEF